MLPHPHLIRSESNGIGLYSDPALIECGVAFAFTERGGGISDPPFASLNLGTHVGDDVNAVLWNRQRLLDTALAQYSGGVEALHVPEQTHGEHIAIAAKSESYEPFYATDAIMTSDPSQAILLCFADCVPVILAAPKPAVCVVHAGWKGALASLPGKAAVALADHVGCDLSEINAYAGPHIRACCYETSEEILSQFVDRFGKRCRASEYGEHHLALEEAIRASLTEVGVEEKRIAEVGLCTSDNTDRFFSYRAENGTTGRHGAIAFVL